MTEQELEAFRSYHTQKALEGLRNHLKKHEGEHKRALNELCDAGKTKEADLLEHFVNGSYDGRPKRPSIGIPPRSKWILALKIVLSMLLLSGLAVLVAYVLRDPEMRSKVPSVIFGWIEKFRSQFQV